MLGVLKPILSLRDGNRTSLSFGSHGHVVGIVRVGMRSTPSGWWHEKGNGVHDRCEDCKLLYVLGKVPHKWYDKDQNTADIQNHTLQVRAGCRFVVVSSIGRSMRCDAMRTTSDFDSVVT